MSYVQHHRIHNNRPGLPRYSRQAVIRPAYQGSVGIGPVCQGSVGKAVIMVIGSAYQTYQDTLDIQL